MARSASERQRLMRERQRRDLYAATAWVSGRSIEAAIAAGLVTAQESKCREALGSALALVFEDWAAKRERK